MKNVSLRTLIPLAAAGALVTIGCGGKATDGVVGDGDGDGDGDPSNPPPSDPLSDENFGRSLEARVDEYCDRVQSCDAFGSHSECVTIIGEGARRGYNNESRRCRGLLLDAFECVNDSWDGCYDYADDCSDISTVLFEECSLYDAYYY